MCSTIESELPAYFDASDIRAFGRLHGVGRETIAKIRQIYRTGALRRADVMRSDPKLHARQELMRVWGIGSARADDLIDMGIHSVEQVRRVQPGLGKLRSRLLRERLSEKKGTAGRDRFLANVRMRLGIRMRLGSPRITGHKMGVNL